ncbi:SDR family oxidoreductase [Cohnella nanjingensis]|uniref:SDR family oxidoreductase n=1 Tax=Cohnella nanjingensis TaxID=1387779 RepID=A0A7X0RMU5_9BACL|nr:SDR family oxidoreductase [Cohnella nanjingensis]MBB6670443.1 SDR family oxidoreductase [Cohnella nanjingensis]
MNTILITGASSGIGRATARYFADQGWHVVATMRSPEQETELNQLPRVLVTRLDVEQPPTIQEAIASGIRQFGKIDVLLNNAGYAAFGVFEAADPEQMKRQFDVNVFGPMYATQAILPHFRSNGTGTIINVSSIGGRITFPLLTLYHASKWAVEGFSESLYYELGTQNIKVKVVEPGNVSTDFTGRSLDILSDETLESYRAYAETVLQKQMDSFQTNVSSPEAIAKAIYDAATDPSDRLRYLAGEDAHFLMNLRAGKPDEEFMEIIAANFR